MSKQAVNNIEQICTLADTWYKIASGLSFGRKKITLYPAGTTANYAATVIYHLYFSKSDTEPSVTHGLILKTTDKPMSFELEADVHVWVSADTATALLCALEIGTDDPR